MHRHTYKSHPQGNGYPSSGYGSYQQPGYGCLAPYPPTSFSSMSPYQVNPPPPPCSIVQIIHPQDLSVAGYGMPSLSASGATIASPDSSLKPELRFSTFLRLLSWVLAETIVFSSWKHLQNFWLTASQKVAAEGEGVRLPDCADFVPPPPQLIFALILTCKWNQRILCDWTQSNQTRQPSTFARRTNTNSILFPAYKATQPNWQLIMF